MVLSARGLVCQQAGGYGLEEARMITPYLFPSKKSEPWGEQSREKTRGGVQIAKFQSPIPPPYGPLGLFSVFLCFSNSLTHRNRRARDWRALAD